MKTYYPIALNLSGKKVVVIGGGKVAERKITGLLAAQAAITVVSPEVTEKIKQFFDRGQLIWQSKSFDREDIDGAFMIFAATDDQGLNEKIKNSASGNQLVSLVDDPEGSDFHVPARIQRGRLTIAVSTGGASPILAQRICRELEEKFDVRYEDYLEFLYQARQQIVKNTTDPLLKRKLLEAITNSLFLHSENREADLINLYDFENRCP